MAEPASLEEALKVIENLRNEVQVLRHFSGKYDLESLAGATETLQGTESPEIGSRVRVVHAGSKYNAKDFEKAGTFSDVKGEFTETVQNNDLGIVMQKANHFKRAEVEVFLIKFDSGKLAIMSRKGFHPIIFVGGPVTVVNQGCKYAAKDFQTQPGFDDIKLIDDVRTGQNGLLLRQLPHYRAKNTTCYVVAVDEGKRCVVLAGKGITVYEPPGLSQLIARRKQEREAEAAKRKAAEAAEGEPDAKRPTTEGEAEGEKEAATADS